MMNSTVVLHKTNVGTNQPSQEQLDKELAETIAKLTATFEDRAITSIEQFQPKATHWLVDQFLPEGDSILAGASFVGKTFVLTNLVNVMLGLITQENLVASRRRDIVWITEDVDQILQALSVLDYNEGCSSEDFFKHCLLVPAQRVQAELLGPVVENLIKARGWDSSHNPPLIIVDTMAASLECEDINQAAKASKLLASLRQCWRAYSILITMHTAKAGDNKEAMGSVAFKADMQNAFYVNNFDKGENMREVSYTKRRADGQIKRIITELDRSVPVELEDRDGNWVTEWIPKIRLVGQTAEERDAFDEEHKTEGKPDAPTQKAEEAEKKLEALLKEMGKHTWVAKSQTALANRVREALPELAGSIDTTKRRIAKAIKEGRLIQQSGNEWVLKDVLSDLS
jgi:hypothetical protein